MPCALCLEKKSLQRSHIIPNAIFKKIFRSNNGRAIRLIDDPSSPISYSQESFWEELLCSNCESLINKNYESFALNVIRGGIGQVNLFSSGLSISDLDLATLRLFFLSILWRAAKSSQECFGKIRLPAPILEELRVALINRQNISNAQVSVRLSRLIDRTVNGFTPSDLKSLIVFPFSRIQPNRSSFHIIFEGFLVDIYIPGLRYKERIGRGVIRPGQRSILIPYVSIFKIPELSSMMTANYGKHESGNTRIK